MAATIPTFEPSGFAAGDSVSWTKSLSDYAISDGWGLLYCFRGNELSALDITSTASGSLHLLSISTTQSANLLPGTYTVAGFAVKTGERVQIYAGQIEVGENFAALEPGVDTRTHAKRTLDNIEAVIEGRASSSVLNSTVNGTSLQRIPVADLLNLRDYYAQKVFGEQRALAAGQGRSTDRRILASFT